MQLYSNCLFICMCQFFHFSHIPVSGGNRAVHYHYKTQKNAVVFSLEVSSAARATALSTAHVLTRAPRQTRLSLLFETSPDSVSITVCPLLLSVVQHGFIILSTSWVLWLDLVLPYHVSAASSLSFECKY